MPGNAKLARLLATTLIAARRLDEARRVLETALGHDPGNHWIAAELGKLLLVLGEHEAALVLADRFHDEAWAAALAMKLWLRGLDAGDFQQIETRLAAVDPTNLDLFELRSRRLFGDPAALMALADDLLRHRPGAAPAVHYKVAALAMLGRIDEAAALLGLDRFVDAAMPDFAQADFLEELDAEIRANPSLHPDPLGHAQRGGLRTREFPRDGDAAAHYLISRLEDAIVAYAASLSGEHPFIAARPDHARLTSWAMVFGPDGHQVHHIHPDSWMTGVFYVTAPAGDSPVGAIRLGELPAWSGMDTPWPVPEFAPTPGRLLLFPSHVAHATVPTGSEQARVAIAFDVASVGRTID